MNIDVHIFKITEKYRSNYINIYRFGLEWRRASRDYVAMLVQGREEHGMRARDVSLLFFSMHTHCFAFKHTYTSIHIQTFFMHVKAYVTLFLLKGIV